MVTPSWLIPELERRALRPWSDDPEQNRYLLGGLRVVVHGDGRVDRAAERFPSGGVEAIPMPERFGGGFLFYQVDSRGTRSWRAEDWTAVLKPLSYISPQAREIVPGFDRLYVRTPSGSLLALDPDTGQPMPRGPLPPTSAWGAMAFADGWRGVVETELRGPLVTFDAGATWLPLPIDGGVRTAGVYRGDPVLYTSSGSFRVDAGGQVHRLQLEGAASALGSEDEPEVATHPLGKRPLRRIIENGWPIGPRKAMVLYRGALLRVALPTGVVEAQRPDVLEDEDATCTGAKVGDGFGFVCGVEDGPTRIYRYRAPLGLDVVASFDEPRFVSSGGNGAFAVRGPCSPKAEDDTETRLYCVVARDGRRHEIAVRGELGAERVVALRNGRVVVLVPPRLDRPGRVTVIAGDKLQSHELKYPKDAEDAVAVARSGLWLEGFEERKKGRIGGWVEAGGPVVGVEIDLKTGQVELGKVHDQGGYVLTAGRFALAVTDVETARESIDGGRTWTELEMPRLVNWRSPDVRARGCTPVGCALQGWLRMGWGDPAAEKDLEVVEPPPSATVTNQIRSRPSFGCTLARVPDTKPPRQQPQAGESPFSSWMPFRGEPPPHLAKGQVGVDRGSSYGAITGAHVYVWGPKGADWTKTGSWQVRFDDPYAFEAVRKSGETRSPWPDLDQAAMGIGARNRSGYWRWDTDLDPGGTSGLASLCMGSRCRFYSLAEGEPLVLLRPRGATLLQQPGDQGVVRIGETVYMLQQGYSGADPVVWRGHLGHLEPVTKLRRLQSEGGGRGYMNMGLVRRVHGSALGVLVMQPPDPASGHQVGRWLVYPLDAVHGVLGEPIDLGMTDLDGETPGRCTPGDDGWLIATTLPGGFDVRLTDTSGYVSNTTLRMRLDPGHRCIDAIAGQASGTFVAADGAQKGNGTVEPSRIPLIAHQRYGDLRYELSCAPR